MNCEILELFATPIKKIQFDDDKFFTEIGKLVFDKIAINKLSLHGGCSTKDNLHELVDFKELRLMIENEVTIYFEDYLGLNYNDFHMSGMWGNVQQSGAQHTSHVHPNSFFSGVIYLNIPTDDLRHSGIIVFKDPRQARTMFQADWNKTHGLSYRSWGITPKVGLLILFPSWLEHQTDRCILPDDTFRISLSFNYILDKCSINTARVG